MGYRYANTVLLLLPDGPLKLSARAAAADCSIDIWESECAIDLIGAPYFLALVEPTLIAEGEWIEFCDYLADAGDTETKVLMGTSSDLAYLLPKANRVALNDRDGPALKFLMLRLRAAAQKRRAAHERVERRIVRLMWIVRELQAPAGLRLRDAARHFEASVRTIQRDLDVLTMAGYIISDGPERGIYCMPSGLLTGGDGRAND